MRAARGKSPERLEVERILSLEVLVPPDKETVEIESFKRLQVEAFMSGRRLRPLQVAAMQAWEARKGGFLPLGVGSGKTLVGLMICQDALLTGMAKKCLLVLPPSLVISLMKGHIPMYRKWIGLPFNFHHFAGKSRAARLQLAASNAPGVYVLPYSLLSTADTVEVLETLDADVVIADEAHRIKNLGSAGTRRLMNWVRSRVNPPKLVGMSGTIMRKSIMDFHHIITAALHNNAPVPLSRSAAFAWSMVLDAGASPPAGLTESTLKPLIEWAGTEGEDAARLAFRKRLVTTLGVVASGDERPGASLLIHEADCGKPSEKLIALIKKVEDQGETPDGEPIDHAINGHKWVRELSAGFYNSLVWPTAEQLVKSRGLTQEDAEDQIERAREHHEAVKDYNREAREYFKNPKPWADTPALLGAAISRGMIEGDLALLWHRHKSMEFAGMPERIRKPMRVCDHKVLGALKWAQNLPKGEGGIIWVFHQEMGRWIFEVLKDFGLNPIHAPAGAVDAIEEVGDPARGGKGDRIVVASMGSHGTGRNLQAFSRQLFVEWPRGAPEAEQTLGRIHRSGQLADEVTAGVLLSTDFDHLNRAACLSDAVAAQLLTSLEQRIITCDYDPMPLVIPPEVLRVRGMQPQELNAQAREFVQSRFGQYTRKFDPAT